MCSSSSQPLLLRVVRAVFSSTWFLGFLPSVDAQINIADSSAAGNQVDLGTAYTQSFDSLANTNTSPVPWVNNGTLPGWYAYRQSSGAVTAYNPSQGGAPDFGSFGALGSLDRALGSGLNGGQADSLHFGVRFVNDAAPAITGFDISFDGEQWYYGDSIPGVTESLKFSYQIFDAGQGSLSAPSGWTAVNALEFVSPVANSTSYLQGLNGNLPANRREGIADSFTGLTLATGQELWLRWTATNLLQISDHSLAIDSLSVRFTAVPEPAAYVALAGGFAFSAVLCRRKRRAELALGTILRG
jgi:uncharacterized protein